MIHFSRCSSHTSSHIRCRILNRNTGSWFTSVGQIWCTIPWMLKNTFRWTGWINSSRWSGSSHWYKSIWSFLDTQIMTSSLRGVLLYLRFLTINTDFIICDHLWKALRSFPGDPNTQRHNSAFTYQSVRQGFCGNPSHIDIPCQNVLTQIRFSLNLPCPR